MIAGLVVGLVIAFFQALTQIQEMTLVFVPKIIAIFAALLIFLPLMGGLLANFSDQIFTRIAEF
jgi:flagellar biosynthetic protein FliQ